MGREANTPPSTRQYSEIDAIPSGSSARTLTVTAWLAAGTTGKCVRSLNVGPTLATKVEFCAPGVPVCSGASRMNVCPTRLR